MPDRIASAVDWFAAFWPKLLLIGAAIKGSWEALKVLIRLGKTLSSIYEDLQPNGGTSLRDAIDMITIRIDEVEKMVLQDEAERCIRQREFDEFREEALHRLRGLDGGPDR